MGSYQSLVLKDLHMIAIHNISRYGPGYFGYFHVDSIELDFLQYLFRNDYTNIDHSFDFFLVKL